MVRLIVGRDHKLATRLWAPGFGVRMFAPGCRGVRELPLQTPLRALGARQGGRGKQQAAMGIAVHPASERRCGDRLPRRRLPRGAAVGSDAGWMPPGMAATCCQGRVRKTALPWRRYRHAEAVFPMPMGNRQASARKKPQTVPRSGARHGLRWRGRHRMGGFFPSSGQGCNKWEGRCSGFSHVRQAAARRVARKL